MATEQDYEELLRLLSKSSLGDLSVLQAALAKSADQEVAMTTTPGSNNDALWTAMVALGWMTLKEDVIRTSETAVPIKVFSLTLIGRNGVAALLEKFDQKRKRDEKLAAIYNRLVQEIPAQIVEPVRTEGGGQAHVVMILAGVLTTIMDKYISPENQEMYLNRLFAMAKERIKDQGQINH